MKAKIKKIFIIWFKQLRIHHWIKNTFVFVPLLFSGKFLQFIAIKESTLLFTIFCTLSSSVYIFNDFIDLNRDKFHPKKKLRPLAAGLIPKNTLVLVGIILCLISFVLSLLTNTKVFLILLFYLLNNIFYSIYLKNKVLADVLSISIGFMLRFIGGAFVIEVEPSRWLLICGFSLSLFLAFGKRRTEIELLNKELKGSEVRPILDVYDKDKLNTALSVVNSICIMTYLLFVSDPETISRHQSNKLIYTVPIVIYCLFRYMYKAQEGEGTGPIDIIFKDKAFIIAISIWLIIVFSVLY